MYFWVPGALWNMKYRTMPHNCYSIIYQISYLEGSFFKKKTIEKNVFKVWNSNAFSIKTARQNGDFVHWVSIIIFFECRSDQNNYFQHVGVKKRKCRGITLAPRKRPLSGVAGKKKFWQHGDSESWVPRHSDNVFKSTFFAET